MNTNIQQELQRGWTIQQQRRYADAEQIYRQVIAQAPTNANAWCFLGMTLHDQRQFSQAIDAYKRALQIQPKFPVALNNMGNSLRYLQRIDEADACFQKAIDLQPDYLNAFKNRGTLHVWSGNLERGLKFYELALRINPNEAELHRNLGVIYLLQGRFEEGWAEYRWRWRVGDLHRPKVPAPVWDGSDLRGKSILLTAEQGLGDTLHFVRFAQVLREQGANTTVYCQPALVALLRNSTTLGPMFPNSLPFERPVDYQCSLLDAADLMRVNADSIPKHVPYVFPAENLMRYWSNRFPKNSNIFRVGIAWQGNPDHQADMFRSIPLKHFETLASLPRVELISLQSGFGTEQLGAWQGARPVTVLDPNLDQTSGAFMDTAAIMRHLDLIVTSDTSIAHLAGALGVPTWIALNCMPDWRWLLNRADSPWYPSVRLYRQTVQGDWAQVFAAIRDDLAGILA